MIHPRKSFERFCFKHRSKGIPNLMLYIALGNAIVLLLSMINGGNVLYNMLYFDKNKILEGQVWRLVTYVFTQSEGGFLGLIFLYFFYLLGRHVELSMGTFKFNLFYFSGVVLMDIFAMIFCPVVPAHAIPLEEVNYLRSVLPVYWQMASYLHLSLILTYATTHPDSQFLIFFIIPVRAWLIALIYLLLIGIDVVNLTSLGFFPHNLFPLVALANYFLFFGKDVLNVLPLSWRIKLRPSRRSASQPKAKVVQFRPAGSEFSQKERPNYNHKCTICGRTDVSDPDLEFRYCSRCTGYHCYCIEHINNHAHIEE